jgi:hypothetical protein
MGETGAVIPQSPPLGSLAPDPRPKLPGRAGIAIGVVLIVAGIVAGVALIVAGARDLVGGVDDFQRLPIRTGGVVEVEEEGVIAVFVERDAFGGSGGTSYSTGGAFVGPSVGIIVTSADGVSVPVSVTGTNYSYTSGGREGVRIATFGAEAPGSYRIETVLRGDLQGYDRLAVGPDLDLGGLAGILGGIFGGGLLVLLGVVVIIVSAVRRSRAKRRLRPPPGYGGAPSGGGWAPPPVAIPGGYGPPSGPSWAPPGQTWAPPPSAPATGPGWVPPPVPGQPGPGWVPPPAPPPPASTPPTPPPPGYGPSDPGPIS